MAVFSPAVLWLLLVLMTVSQSVAQQAPGRRLTPQELELYNGTKGRSGYVAVEGKIYDISESPYWKGGVHQKSHRAGTDLTEELKTSPHKRDVLQNMAQVGVLVKPKNVPAFLEAFLSRHPVLRRHPHPISVHFPVAFLFGSAVFLLLNLFRPRSGTFEQIAYGMFIMGIIFTPPAIITGLWSWWVIYSFEPLNQILYKIVLSSTLIVAEFVCLIIAVRRPLQREGRGWLYLGLMLYLSAAALAIAYFGGQLTYGY